MAIAYKEEALPNVSMLSFDINRWAGVNKIKGGQYDYEMTDCVNMSSDHYPYASPRKPRKKLINEEGIKRIYKVEDGKIYYIDAEDYLCYTENGVKSYVTDKNDESIQMSDVTCTNNYDKTSMFYPYLVHVNNRNEVKSLEYPISFGETFEGGIELDDEFGDETLEYFPQTTDNGYYTIKVSSRFDIVNTDIKEICLSMTFPEDGSYELPYPNEGHPDIVLRIYDKDGNTKKYTGTDGKEHLIIYKPAKFEGKETKFTLPIPDGMTLEEGDYFLLRLSYETLYWVNRPEMRTNLYYHLKADWKVIRSETSEIATGPILDYGVVYNNRIVGVRRNDIQASALGDFTNFWEYADEAGNPSATGAYATNVGSAGGFTGICAYNNVLLLFKKDIVYEMYGSMPYTITEMCNTGCIDNDSICSIDGVLYWASPKGIVRYSGGVPTVISKEIDIHTDILCKAGTDGRKYYVYDGHKTFVYDTYYQMWHIYDELNIKMMYNHINDLYAVYDDGIYKADSGNEAVEWEFTTKDYTFSSKERKNLSKLWVRTDMTKNSNLEIYVRQNGGQWSRVAVKTAERDEMFDFKLRVKKCDSFALKFKGKGDVRILDIHGKVTVGTSKHRSGTSLNTYRR